MLMTPKQAAERACVSVSLIYQWCQTGGLPHLRVGSSGRRGKILIDDSDLDGYLASFKVTAVPKTPAATPHQKISTFRHLRVT
jgi:excisionase family DNA binding protein